jgi:hypothetical protein
MAARLGLAALFGVVVAAIYRLSHGRLARDASTLMGTLVLLTILLAMVTMVIGESVARAFGLVGALSIVRFRTVVEDTRDTAFVIFAVVVGMAVGTGLVLVASLGVPVVGLAAVGLAARARATAPEGVEHGRTLAVRLGAGHTHEQVDRAVNERARSWRLAGVATARQGAAVDLTYTLDLPDGVSPLELVAHLNTLAGVQSIDLRAGRRPE